MEINGNKCLTIMLQKRCQIPREYIHTLMDIHEESEEFTFSLFVYQYRRLRLSDMVSEQSELRKLDQSKFKADDRYFEKELIQSCPLNLKARKQQT